MSLVEGFVSGLKAYGEQEKRKQIEEQRKAAQPKGALTGNTVDNIASGTVTPDSPIYPESVKMAGAIKSSKSGLDLLKKYEGFRGNVYKDTEGYDTVGYGHKLTQAEIKSGKYKNGMTEAEAAILLQNDRKAHISTFYENNPWAKNEPKTVRTAMEDMAFNMGPGWLEEWPNTKAAIKSGKYDVAAANIKNSKYAKQVGYRARENAERFKLGMTDQSTDTISQDIASVNNLFDETGNYKY